MTDFLRAAFAAVLLLAPGSLVAQQPEPARWVSRWDRGECQLIRAVGDKERLGLRAVPNAEQVSLWAFPDDDVRAPRGGRLRAVVAAPPATATLASDRVNRSGVRGNRSYEIVLPLSALEVLAAATAVRVDINGVRVIDLPLRSSAAAIDVLRQCMRDQSAPQPH